MIKVGVSLRCTISDQRVRLHPSATGRREEGGPFAANPVGGGVSSPELRPEKNPIAWMVGRGPTDDTTHHRRGEGRESASPKQTSCRACVYVTPKLGGVFVPARMTLFFLLRHLFFFGETNCTRGTY